MKTSFHIDSGIGGIFNEANEVKEGKQCMDSEKTANGIL